jgi:hypothetical protein
MTSYVGKIPDHELDDDNIKWLVIVPDVHNSAIVGYFINFHESLDQTAKFDNWYQTLEDALAHGDDYGIKKEDWQPIDTN